MDYRLLRFVINPINFNNFVPIECTIWPKKRYFGVEYAKDSALYADVATAMMFNRLGGFLDS